jgi:acyl-CoA synthetase (AMP-forming)/AMP-acid ligase II
MARNTYGGKTRSGGDRIKDGWVYPGDIGSVDRNNFLTIQGRASDVIIRNGVNVHPSEVEVVLSTMPGIREVAVVGYSAQREGEEIAAFVVTNEPISEAQLTAHCRAALAPDKRPRKFLVVQDLPRNASGKVLRSALAEQAAQTANSDPENKAAAK